MDERLKEVDWKEFFKQAEEICFNCGTSITYRKLIKVGEGVALCEECLETVKEVYPIKKGGENCGR